MIKVKLGEVTVNLDNRRKPLNNVQRQEKSVVKKYAYCGANNIVDYIDDYIFDETDEILCIAEDGGSWGKEEKCTYIMREKCWVNNHAHVIKMNEGVDINYISLFLNYTDLTPYITGSTRGKLTKSSLENIELDLADYEAQVGISKKILSIQDLMEQKEKQLAKLSELVKSRFYEMFGDLFTNPYSFPIVHLSEIAEYYNGLTYKPEMVVEDKSGTIVLRSSNIQDSKLDFNDIVRVNIQAKEKNIVRKNDILMCSRNGSAKLVGKTAIINKTEKMYFGAFMMLIRSQYFEFLQQYFQTKHFRSTVRQGATTTINQITVKMMDKVKIPLPPLALQNQFADFVAEVDKSQLAIKKSLEELETLKKSLMQAYFG